LPRVKLSIIPCLEDAIGFVGLYGGIFFYAPLKLSFDKLLIDDLKLQL
jgi:hypothetical protein